MTKANIVLGMVAAVSAVGCFILFKDSVALRNRVGELEAQLGELHREATVDTSASQADTPAIDVASSEASAPAAASAPLQPSTPTVTKPAREENNKWRAVLADPAYRRTLVARARLELQREHPELAEELGLSPDDAERFFDLLAEQNLRESERAMKKHSNEERMAWQKELNARAEEEQRAFLGEERFANWVEYTKSAQARAIVNDLRTQLATTTSPLLDEQVKPFVKALAAEHTRHAEERQKNYEAETNAHGEWTKSTPPSQRIEYMERRASLIEESLDRQRELGEMYLDSVQRQALNAMLERQREEARVELNSFQAYLEAAERTRSR